MTLPLFLLAMALMFGVVYLVCRCLMPPMPPMPEAAPDYAPTQPPGAKTGATASATGSATGSVIESILVWFVIAMLGLVSVCIVAGASGYIWQRWFA